MRFAVWKGIAQVLAVLLFAALAIANYYFNLRFGEWPGNAQFLFIVASACVCVAIGSHISKRYR